MAGVAIITMPLRVFAEYCIARKSGRELNLVVWLYNCQVTIHQYFILVYTIKSG